MLSARRLQEAAGPAIHIFGGMSQDPVAENDSISISREWDVPEILLFEN